MKGKKAGIRAKGRNNTLPLFNSTSEGEIYKKRRRKERKGQKTFLASSGLLGRMPKRSLPCARNLTKVNSEHLLAISALGAVLREVLFDNEVRYLAGITTEGDKAIGLKIGFRGRWERAARYAARPKLP